MKQEMLPVVTKTDRFVRLVPRSECHEQGLLHRTVSVLVYKPGGELLVQHRAKGIELYPDLLTLSATGHVNDRNTYRRGALAELSEELGITQTRLVKLAKLLIDIPTHRTMTTVFKTTYDGVITPDPKEVQAVIPMDQNQIRENLNRFTPNSRYVLEQLQLI